MTPQDTPSRRARVIDPRDPNWATFDGIIASSYFQVSKRAAVSFPNS